MSICIASKVAQNVIYCLNSRVASIIPINEFKGAARHVHIAQTIGRAQQNGTPGMSGTWRYAICHRVGIRLVHNIDVTHRPNGVRQKCWIVAVENREVVKMCKYTLKQFRVPIWRCSYSIVPISN